MTVATRSGRAPRVTHRSGVVTAAAAAVVVGSGCVATEIAPETAPQPEETGAGAAPPDDATGATGTATPSTDGVAATSAGPQQTDGSPSATAEPQEGSCALLIEEMGVEDQVGQLFMLGVDTTTGLTGQVETVLQQTRTGQVVLLGDTDAGVDGVRQLTDALRDSASGAEEVGLLVAVDQEGGQVQRLRGPGFDRIPAAVEQATWSADELAARASDWGEQLTEAGVDVDLAPVADVVPPDKVATNEPVGVLGRHYGTDVAEVSAGVEPFLAGMAEAGIGTSLKHFPGLGEVVGNTDFSADVADTTTTRDDPGLQAFADGIDAGASTVMVGTAVYEQIDPGVPAAFSSVVIEQMLRGDLGFEGVVISDDLGAAAQVQPVPPGDRALGFLEAGGDVVINGDPAIHTAMVEATLEQAEADEDFADEIATKATRVLDLKAALGLADCTPGSG